MNLKTIFSSADYIATSLELYTEHYASSWQPGTKLDLYNMKTSAFKPGLQKEDALRLFDPLYSILWWNWKLYRGGCLSYWQAEEVLQHLMNIRLICGTESPLTLQSLEVEECNDLLLPVFNGLSNIKRQKSGDYPWVAASKFLHVFNPKLFPIYDISIVWNVALNGCFKEDYVEFCRQTKARPGERSARFNCTYTAFAADLMQNSGPDLMPMFADWFKKWCVGWEDDNSLLDDVHTYYATAFEIVLIGATKL